MSMDKLRVDMTAFIDDLWIFNAREYIVYLIFGVLCSTPVFKWIREKLRGRSARLGEAVFAAHDLIQFILFVFAFTFLVMNAHNPFIYFNF